jgi:hypothetical protein
MTFGAEQSIFRSSSSIPMNDVSMDEMLSLLLLLLLSSWELAKLPYIVF